jgi:hypothetical protein
MKRLRNKLLILILLGMVLVPQLYQAAHLIGHRHDAACNEVNVTHFHEKHPDCKLCVHVVPALFSNLFDEFSVASLGYSSSMVDHYVDQFFEISNSFFWLRGPPHFVFS